MHRGRDSNGCFGQRALFAAAAVTFFLWSCRAEKLLAPLNESGVHADINFLFRVNSLWYQPADVGYTFRQLPSEYIVDCRSGHRSSFHCVVAEPEASEFPHGPHRDVEGWMAQVDYPIHVVDGVACPSNYGRPFIKSHLSCQMLPGSTPWDAHVYNAQNCTVHFYSAFHEAILSFWFILWISTVIAEVSVWIISCMMSSPDVDDLKKRPRYFQLVRLRPLWTCLMWLPAILTLFHLMRSDASYYSCNDVYSIEVEIGMSVLVFVGSLLVLLFACCLRSMYYFLPAGKLP